MKSTGTQTSPLNINSLEEEKKKLIKNIRGILNDYPALHPIADNFFKNSTLTILKGVWLQMLELDTASPTEKKKPVQEKKIKESLQQGKKHSTLPSRVLAKHLKKSNPAKKLNIAMEM
jgi:hypothetical protein